LPSPPLPGFNLAPLLLMQLLLLLFAVCFASLVGNLVYFPFFFTSPVHSKEVDVFRGDLAL
jgi:hypothetical protein